MKKLILLTTIFALFATTACKKEVDYTLPENLSGTTWQWDNDLVREDNPDLYDWYEGYKMKQIVFTSETNFYYYNEHSDGTTSKSKEATYYFNEDNEIILNDPNTNMGDNFFPHKGKFKGEELTWRLDDEHLSIVFKLKK